MKTLLEEIKFRVAVHASKHVSGVNCCVVKYSTHIEVEVTVCSGVVR